MKRIFIAVLIICVLPLTALADPVDTAVIFYNSYARNFNISSLPGKCSERINKDGKTEKEYTTSENVKITYTTDGKSITDVVVVAETGNEMNFLAVCSIVAFSVMESSFEISVIGDMFYQIMGTPVKEIEVHYSSAGGYAYQVYKPNEDIISMIFVKAR